MRVLRLSVNYFPPPPRKQRETQEEYEQRFCALFNESQPNAVHKVVGCHILRN